MNRFEFLANLSANLSDLTPEDRRRVTDYYTEMIDDRMEEGLTEEEAISSIGDPENDAREMLMALGIQGAVERNDQEAAEKPAESAAGLSDEAIERAMRNIALPEKVPEPKAPVRRRSAWPLIRILIFAVLGTAAAVLVGKYSVKMAMGVLPFARYGSIKEQMKISEKVQDIRIITGSGDVKFEVTSGTEVKVNMSDAAFKNYSVTAENGQLIIEYRAEQRFLQSFIFPFGRSETDIVIGLPLTGGSYGLYNLKIETSSGSIELPKILTVYETMKLKTSSGDIKCNAALMGSEAKITTSSGSVDCIADSDQAYTLKGLSIQTSSGDIYASGLMLTRLNAESSSGDIRLHNMSLNEFEISSSSGDVELFEGSSLKTLEKFRVTTTSGDVELKLIDVPKIQTKTNSGKVVISPVYGKTEGSFEIHTTSGDIIVNRQ